jgi:hypothetical protein
MEFKQIQDCSQCKVTTGSGATVLSPAIPCTMPPDSCMWMCCTVKAASGTRCLETTYHTFCRRPPVGPTVIHETETDRVDLEGNVHQWKKTCTVDMNGNVYCQFESPAGTEVDWINMCSAYLCTH